MDKCDLQSRTKQFALRALKLSAALPRSPEAAIIRGQLARCGTSVGSNYRAACKARSRAEFIAKMGTVEEEADESGFWMEMIIEGGFMKSPRVHSLLRESYELTRIMGASRVTASRRQTPKSIRQSAIGNGQ
jgi:four helix bundle protein